MDAVFNGTLQFICDVFSSLWSNSRAKSLNINVKKETAVLLRLGLISPRKNIFKCVYNVIPLMQLPCHCCRRGLKQRYHFKRPMLIGGECWLGSGMTKCRSEVSLKALLPLSVLLPGLGEETQQTHVTWLAVWRRAGCWTSGWVQLPAADVGCSKEQLPAEGASDPPRGMMDGFFLLLRVRPGVWCGGRKEPESSAQLLSSLWVHGACDSAEI